MRTVKLIIAFDGTGYCGWQRQENGPSIQQELEKAVSLICNQSITVHGAGRTDAGVHALAMSAHFQTTSRITLAELQRGLNALLPAAIRITAAADIPADFHARFSARAKTYRYAVFTGPVQSPFTRLYAAHCPYQLSAAAMQSCLEIIIGCHDFASFETTGSRDRQYTEGRGAVRTILKTELLQPEPELFHLLFKGDGFLRHMVRNLAGTIIEVGRGKRGVEEFGRILAARDRQKAGGTAPAHGLTLIEVHYAD